MLTLARIDETRRFVAEQHRGGRRVALVPTMGNLHEGHLALVRRARECADTVIASIFVNPLQFGEGEDYSSYPRTEERDQALLADAGCDGLFLPTVGEMYPEGGLPITIVEVPGLSNVLCGAHRPGHFRGVTTVVAKLFNLVDPDIAVFGAKDYQQLVLIQRMVDDLCFPVEIVPAPTGREDDGLAMSSRNQYLTEEERATAPALYRELCHVAGTVSGGGERRGTCDAMIANLEAAGFRPDYVEVRRASDLAEPGEGDTELVVLAAAWLGKARLIDNVRFSLEA